tara:strand:+ start:87 stop:272 length:186 start_codon:yes stop_codon:yes gene_type:complete
METKTLIEEQYNNLGLIEANLRRASTHLSEEVGKGSPEPDLIKCANQLREIADFIDEVLNR